MQQATTIRPSSFFSAGIYRAKKKRDERHKCPNCGYRLSTDNGHNNFCPNCGQESHTPRKPILHFLQDLVECVFHYDSKTLFTMRTLMLHPGRVSREHNLNIRARYTPPTRLFLFTLTVFIVFFEIAQLTMVERDVNGLNDVSLSQELTLLSDTARIPFSNPFFNGDKIYFTVAQLKELKSLPSSEVKSWLARHHQSTGLIHRLEARMIRHNTHSTLSMADFNRHIVRIHYQVVFIMMPFSALLIFLFFYRRGRTFYDSLVTSIHLYVFGLITGIAVTLIILFLMRVGVLMDTTIVLPVVMFISLTFNFIPAYKKVFERSWASTIFRGLAIGTVNMSVQVLVFWLVAGYLG